MKRVKIILGLLVGGMIIMSCGDSEPLAVNVQFQINVGEDALVQESVYNVNETDVKFTNVAFYLGDMKFKTSTNKEYESTSRYHLIREGVTDFNFESELEDEEVSLSEVTFFIGVDSETNSESEVDFTERAATDPLGQQNPSMHWGWSGGYRFMNIDGLADIDGDGEFETKLIYHLGKNEFLKNIALNPDVRLESGANNYQILFDLSSFLSGLDFETENFTKVQTDNISVANKLLDNYNSAITFVK